MKLTDTQFYEKLYRLDGDEDDWAPLIGGEPSSKGPPHTPSPGETDMDSVRYEWLRGTLHTNAYYSCPVTRSEPHEGGVVDVTAPMLFQVTSVTHGSSRPKVVPTCVWRMMQKLFGRRHRLRLPFSIFAVWMKRADTLLT